MSGIDVRVLEDTGPADELAALINAVYDIAERGLWREGVQRTTVAELEDEIRAGEIVVAVRDGRIVGCVRVHDVAEDTSEFGLLAAAPDERNTGIGRALLDYVERRARERGMRAMQLELLDPREWSHPTKEFLAGWYRRRGYELIARREIGDTYPQLLPLLATPCDLQVREKRLVIDE